MGKTLVGLLPLIIAAAVLPTGIVMTLFWLRDRCGLTRAAAFAAGRLSVHLLQGVLVGYALKVIDKAQLRQSEVVLAYLYFAVAAQSLILTPVLLAAVAPVRTPRLLSAAHQWMERYKRGVAIAVSLGFGVWFIRMGIK